MRLLLLVSAFNGLSQRVWCALREAGHEVGVQLATGDQAIIEAAGAMNPDLILCPYLKDRVPTQVWQRWRTVIIHPGPVGDRGPSSLDWAIAEARTRWGVTALQAIDELDAGPVWAARTFDLPADPPRKSALYHGQVADAAVACVFEVVEKAADPAFRPVPPGRAGTPLPGARLRPAMTQADRAFAWGEATAHVVRRIRAADGSPGVRATLSGRPLLVFDAHPGAPADGYAPGTVLAQRDHAVRVATGDGSVWLGHLKPPAGAVGPRIKLPATTLLSRRLRGVPRTPRGLAEHGDGPAEIRYRRDGAVGWLHFDFYNGAMSSGHCRRMLAGLRHAAQQETRVLVLVSGPEVTSNGIHLNVVEAATDPAATAWTNIKALNAVCRAITANTRQVVIAGYGGPAGAGGVMFGLGADVVAARAEIVLNPYYDIGLFGSELHTYTLPRRVGATLARQLLDDRLPVSATAALRMGLVDEVGPRDWAAYLDWLAQLAARAAEPGRAEAVRAAKTARLAGERVPLDAYEARELAEMTMDMFDDRSDFAGARYDFVHKVRPQVTPARLTYRPPAAVRIVRPRKPLRAASPA
ncbi:formyl transferase [Pilimelia terevasa]|uniref:Formyl transferase n=1 Tax=Pilimelia terevasa TaxID=53372 RepID=A0A8J3BHH7_9ACTN|nr:enoyl-CoA hydratase-related protein [Pilimelia terevasa]GGK14640.1 formyl transferase [Pilimelia terevasa]